MGHMRVRRRRILCFWCFNVKGGNHRNELYLYKREEKRRKREERGKQETGDHRERIRQKWGEEGRSQKRS